MPITQPGLMGALAPSLASAALFGITTPQIALGVSNGLLSWLPAIQVVTIDVGVKGVGSGTIALALPPPVLQTALLSSLPSNGIAGAMMPTLATGLANGLSQGLSQGAILTQHPIVGVGTAVCKFVAPPATPFMLAAMSGSGLIGTLAPSIASAIGDALFQVFAAFSIVLPIVGTPSQIPFVGVGTGRIV